MLIALSVVKNRQIHRSLVRPALPYASLTCMLRPASPPNLLDKYDQRQRHIISRSGSGHRSSSQSSTRCVRATFLDTPWPSTLRGTSVKRTYATRATPEHGLGVLGPPPSKDPSYHAWQRSETYLYNSLTHWNLTRRSTKHKMVIIHLLLSLSPYCQD